MDFTHAQALARMVESEPERVRSILYDSGYGDLADQWISATSEFETVARSSLEKERVPEDDDDETPVSADVLRAYARMCLSWSRINQLRDQALGSIEGGP